MKTKITFLAFLGIIIVSLSLLYPTQFYSKGSEAPFLGARRAKGTVQIPQEYQAIVNKLSSADANVRDSAIGALAKVIPSLTDENLKKELTLRIADRLSDFGVIGQDPDYNWDYYVCGSVPGALAVIIPSLIDENLKEELTLRLVDMLRVHDQNILNAINSALEKIAFYLTDKSLKTVALKVADMFSEPDIPDRFGNIFTNVRSSAADALISIIPSLTDENLKKELAFKVAGMLSDIHRGVRRSAVRALGRIIPSIGDERIRQELTHLLEGYN